ncbi:MAG: hypothetical protein NT124_04520 [Candidatus Dependentiae bacterium]|nr:hypothetical protein [Candidatus Dependentiae bacterium]
MNKKKNFNLFLLCTLSILGLNGLTHARNARQNRRNKKTVDSNNEQKISGTTLTEENTVAQSQKDTILVAQNNPLPLFIKPDISNRSLPLELQTNKITEQSFTVKPTSELAASTKALDDQDEKIEFNFQDADLQTLVTHIAELFDITFITDDMIQPMPQGSHALKGNKISFKTNKLLSKKEAWDLFITFLSMSKFAVVPDSNPRIFRIKTEDAAKKSPLTTFIGIDPTTLPNNDQLIRYVYFIENSPIDTIKAILEKLRSPSSDLIILTNHKAFVLTDKAHNIKTLMQIVKELDKVSMPQSMSVLKLRRADAVQVKELYDSLINPDKNKPQQFFQARKQPTSLFFPENTTIIAEQRTNSLILLGTKESINKIETFILKNIDVELDIPYSPLYVHQLKYADADTIANIMTQVTQLETGTPAAQHGGVRGKDKYMKPITFVAEKETNRIIIKGHYDDYITAKSVIEKLDEPQPQVAIEVLIISVTLTNRKQLGTQIRSKNPGVNGLLGNNVQFQTSGLYQTKQVVTRNAISSGASRLLGNLVTLATGANPGNTIITLGSDAFGVWGIFQALQTVANAQIVSNPFLIATNNTEATIKVGQTRRVQTGLVFAGNSEKGTSALGDEPANLIVRVTPQINADGMIVLNLLVDITNFADPGDPTSATKITRKIETSTIVSNKEILALGGLIKNNVLNDLKKTPVLGDIPILGWLFKNQAKTEDKDNLLILVSTRIIDPHQKKEVSRFNTGHIDDYHGALAKMNYQMSDKDPIQHLFFAPDREGTEQVMDDFLLKRGSIMGMEEPKSKFALRREKRLRNKNKGGSVDPLPIPIPTVTAQLSHKERIETKVPMPPAMSKNLPIAHDITALQEAILNKKRTKLSLTDFFDDAKARA